MEFNWEAWSIVLTSDPRFVKGIWGCLVIKIVVTYLDLDCSNDCRENSDLIELTFFPFHVFMEKSPMTLIIIHICFAL